MSYKLQPPKNRHFYVPGVEDPDLPPDEPISDVLRRFPKGYSEWRDFIDAGQEPVGEEGKDE